VEILATAFQDAALVGSASQGAVTTGSRMTALMRRSTSHGIMEP